MTAQRKQSSEPTRVFDASGKILGRLATEIAVALRGKDQPTFVPYRDPGTTVVVTNTDAVRVTGTKLKTKLRYRHTQHKPGALRVLTLGERLSRDSRQVIRDAVWNMLPKNKLRHRMIGRLKLYRGPAESRVEASREFRVESRERDGTGTPDSRLPT